MAEQLPEQTSCSENADQNDDGGDNGVPGSPLPKRQKRVHFLSNTAERAKVDYRTRMSLNKKINEWYARTKMPAILISLKNGDPCFSCPSELENAFSSFINNDEVCKAFRQSIVQSFTQLQRGAQ